MLYYLSLPFLSILLVVFQSTIADIIFPPWLILELSVVVVVYAGFKLDLAKGAILALVLGFVFDCVGGFVTGTSSLIYVIIFLCSFFISEWLDTGKKYVIAFYSFICSFIKGIVLQLFYYSVFSIDIATNAYVIIFIQSLIVGLIAPVFFHLMSRVEGVLYEAKA
jgi:rod shape-determining protein MreD